MAAMPDAVAIHATAEQLAAVKYDANGLVPGDRPGRRHQDVLMMAWMNAETLQHHARTKGRMVYWSRSRQEVWRKGDTSGDRQFVREAYYDCDGDTLLFLVEQEGKGACHTGEYSCFFRAFGAGPVSGLRMRPSRDEFHALAAEHTVVPVWTELLADLETPVSAYLKLVGDGDGFLLESVEHGERWSRFSFVGHDPVATLELRDGVITKTRSAPQRRHPATTRACSPRSTPILAAYRAPIMPDLPPLQGGVMGYLGYDVVREVEHLPDVPHDDRGMPDAVMSIIGSLAAFDHWRQRMYLIESVPVLAHGRRRRRPRVRRRHARACRRAADKLVAAAAGARRSSRPSRARRRPRCAARWPTACTSRRSRWRRSTSSPATSSRWCSPSATTSTCRPTRSTSTACCAR